MDRHLKIRVALVVFCAVMALWSSPEPGLAMVFVLPGLYYALYSWSYWRTVKQIRAEQG